MQPPQRPRLADLTAATLTARAERLRRMAETATTADVRERLLRLAKRFEDLAREKNSEFN